jgi:iron complex outermembrane receptor protein
MDERGFRTRITRNSNRRVLAIAASGAVMMAAGGSASTAQASISPQDIAAEVRTYRIPAGPMTNALNALADLNGLPLLYDAGVTQRLKTTGLRGKYSVKESLDRLLAGTGLTYRLAANRRTVSIQLAQAATGTRSDAATVALPTVEVTAAARSQNQPGNEAYTVMDTSSVVLTTTPILQTPVSVQVVPRQVIDDQQANRLEDITQNVSGVQRDCGYGNLYEGFTIRGFYTTDIFRNDIRVGRIGAETANIQQVNIVKGPIGAVYGRLEPGGLIDIITKKPLDQPYYNIQQELGSFSFYRTVLDAGGPVTQDKTLIYRLNTSYLNDQSYKNSVRDNNVFVSPAIAWRPTNDFELNLSGEFRHADLNTYQGGYPAIGRTPANLLFSFYGGDRGDRSPLTRYLVDVNLRYDFAPNWNIKAGAVAYWDSIDYRIVFPVGYDETTGILSNAPFFENQRWNGQTYYANVTGAFSAFEADHVVLFGFDRYNQERTDFGFVNGFGTVVTISVFNPRYGYINYGELDFLRASSPDFSTYNRQEWMGYFAQDQSLYGRTSTYS